MCNASVERTSILKEYYTAKLLLLERIVIAKEKKVALLEANRKLPILIFIFKQIVILNVILLP